VKLAVTLREEHRNSVFENKGLKILDLKLTLAIAGVQWSASGPGRFTHGERAPSTYWIGGWVDPRASVDDMEKRKFLTISGIDLRPLSHPAHSQSLY
jgi:hypothetical protein